MTEADEPTPRRRPLRRTAWTLLIGGLVALVLMIGVGLLLLAGGEDIGPGHPVVWAAGERASVHKHPGPQAAGAAKCELIGSDGKPEYRSLDWAESTRSSSEVTITCKQDAIFLTGTASWFASVCQSQWIMVPVAASLIGALLFFPRFTLALARLSNPRRVSD
jgi:hypothetical protein